MLEEKAYGTNCKSDVDRSNMHATMNPQRVTDRRLPYIYVKDRLVVLEEGRSIFYVLSYKQD